MKSGESPLPSLTKTLNERPAALREILESRRPSLLRQLETDAENPALFAAWGLSNNIDAGAKQAVVRPELLQALSGLVGLSFNVKNNVANAGLLHTYGYLLSNLKTPFGFKRARWTNGNLERGLNLPKGEISPRPRTGSLLGNLTKWFPVAAGPGFTLTQTMPEPGVTLITKLIEFANPGDGKGDCAALFYSCTVEDQLRFITAFPVGGWMIGKLRKSARNAEGTILPKYNAVIPELQGRAWPGTIELTDHDERHRTP